MELEFEQTIDNILDTSIQVYEHIRTSKESLEKFTLQFGGIENPYDFIHGYFMGDIQGIAFATARCILGRDMNEEERSHVAKIIKSKTSTVESIIKKIKILNKID